MTSIEWAISQVRFVLSGLLSQDTHVRLFSTIRTVGRNHADSKMKLESPTRKL